jgi:F0F1-type ATP synthase delta subunit
MKSVKHSLQFITELDENEPTAKRLLSLPKEEQTLILEGLLKEIIVPKIKPVLNEVNKNNSWALLRVAE